MVTLLPTDKLVVYVGIDGKSWYWHRENLAGDVVLSALPTNTMAEAQEAAWTNKANADLHFLYWIAASIPQRAQKTIG